MHEWDHILLEYALSSTMLLVYMLIMWQVQALPKHQFNMYNTDHHQDGYCLLYYVLDNIVNYGEPYTLAHQIIPYCLRSSEENIRITDLNFNHTTDHDFTFSDLREKNISSQLLLSWSASIDLAERYQIFLNNISYSSSFEKESLFHNCTSSWFGPFCRFTFDIPINKSFDEIVAFNFRSKSSIKKGAKVTCYKHLDCKTSLLCLDWREICDRKIDCLDESDESHCWQLEMNECAENEYRCHNGQCIPAEFFHDVSFNPDCLDRTDEPVQFFYTLQCYEDPAFRCEEHTCRPGRDEFPCGNGHCTNGLSPCHNGRSNFLLNDSCSLVMACLMKPDDPVESEQCEIFCATINCTKHHCPLFYEFPSGPLLFGHVRFMFSNKEITIDSYRIPVPDYICYDEKLCADYLASTVYLNGSTCRHFHELGLAQSDSYNGLAKLVQNVKDRFRGCLVVANESHNCNHSTMYRCENSTKCISKHRLVDGIQDCPLNDDEKFNQSCSLNDAHYRFACSADHNIKCFAPFTIKDNRENCKYGEDEHENHIYFQTICDGIRELLPVLINGQNETDETNCEYWECNNTYTRCDKFWSCKNGIDEINCPNSTCPEFHHSCVFPNDTSNVSCLPISQAGNDIDDCLGGLDERHHCRTAYPDWNTVRFQCWNDTACIDLWYLCDKVPDCPFGDDETFCENYESELEEICDYSNPFSQTEVPSLLCSLTDKNKRSMIYFTLHNMPIYSLQLITDPASLVRTEIKSRSIRSNQVVNTKSDEEWQCNRGLRIYIRMDGDNSELSCLCPPSYYGDKCQISKSTYQPYTSNTCNIRLAQCVHFHYHFN